MIATVGLDGVTMTFGRAKPQLYCKPSNASRRVQVDERSALGSRKPLWLSPAIDPLKHASYTDVRIQFNQFQGSIPCIDSTNA